MGFRQKTGRFSAGRGAEYEAMIGFKSVKCDMRVCRVPVTHCVGFSEKNISTFCVTFVTQVTMQSLQTQENFLIFISHFVTHVTFVTHSIKSSYFNHVTYVTCVTCVTYVT